MNQSEEQLVERARLIAIGRHDACGHKRSDGEPYWKHPERVMQTLRTHAAASAVLAAAWLHDVPEDCVSNAADCEALLQEIARDFGPQVGSLVREVTNFFGPEASMEEKQARLREHARHMTEQAKWIKLADRLDNISGMHGWSAEKKRRYATATVALLEALSPCPAGADAIVGAITTHTQRLLSSG